MTTVTATGTDTQISNFLRFSGSGLLMRETEEKLLMQKMWSSIGKVDADIASGDLQNQLSGLNLNQQTLIFTKSLKASVQLDVSSFDNGIIQLNSLSFTSADDAHITWSMVGSIKMTASDGLIGGTVNRIDLVYTPDSADPSTQKSVSLTGRMMISDHSIISGVINQASYTQDGLTTVLSGAIKINDLAHSLISSFAISDASDNGISWKGSMKYADVFPAIESAPSIGAFFTDSAFAAKLFSGNDVIRVVGDTPGLGLEEITWKAYAGNDVMIGAANKDVLYGGTGNDRLYGNGGKDALYGEQGNDILNGGDGDDFLFDDSGNNQFDGGQGNDVMGGGRGNDRYVDSDGNNTISDAGGNNVIYTGDGNDQITTGSGNDIIRAGDGKNLINAGDGNNQVWAGLGDDTIVTGTGNDVIRAGEGNNRITTGNGNNQVFAGDGANFITAGDGKDVIRAGDGGNFVIAGGGADKVQTGDGNDVVQGGAGDDVIRTQGGDDLLVGGAGVDKLSGGSGADRFFLNDLQPDGTLLGYDIITDFDASEGDRIQLSSLAFKSLTPASDGTYNFDGHVVSAPSAVAADADDFIVFDQNTKKLYYDADGNGTKAPVMIATLIGVTEVHATDFVLVSV